MCFGMQAHRLLCVSKAALETECRQALDVDKSADMLSMLDDL